jgi:hypothetical protein
MIITFGGCHLVEERSLFEDELHMMLDIPPGQIIQQLAPKLLKPTDLPRRHAGPEVLVRMEFSSTPNVVHQPRRSAWPEVRPEVWGQMEFSSSPLNRASTTSPRS